MYLLYGNREIEDVIESDALKEYERSSKGMLEISYVFSVPPHESNELSYLHGRITPDIIQKWFSDIKAKKSKATAVQRDTLEFSPTFQPYPPYQYSQAGAPSGTTYTPPTSSFPKHDDNISAHNTKIVVCGPPEMMMVVKQTLDMSYSEIDYILLI
jgi:NAD(P)H-flavin reductase